MKKLLGLLIAVLCLATALLAVRPRDEDTAGVARNGVKPATAPAAESKIIGWLAVRLGLPEAELKRQLGSPRMVENKGDFEIWTYPTGTVFVQEGRVIAWKQEKNR